MIQRPTLRQLIQQASADLEAELRNGGVWVRRTFEAATARALAGLVHGLYGFLSWVLRQFFGSTADERYLLAQAADYGVYRKEPTASVLRLTIEATEASVPLPAGSAYVSEAGRRYVTIEDVVTPASAPYETTITVQDTETGSAGNQIPGTMLTFDNVDHLGLTSLGVVNGTGNYPVGSGTDLEDIEVFRERFLAYKRTPPKGGAATDYVKWSKEAGVSRAWERPWQMGPGSLVVVVALDAYNSDGSFSETQVPSDDLCEEVRQYILPRCPVVVQPQLYVLPIVPEPLDPDIAISPDTPALREAVTRELNDLLLRVAEPGVSLRLSLVRAAVSNTPGIVDSIIGSPGDWTTTGATSLFVLGTPNYSEVP